jgi:predicted ATP-dependent endonuclease of OLD family
VYRFNDSAVDGSNGVFQISFGCDGCDRKKCDAKNIKNLFHLENRELFFARKVILVEGYKDRVYFRKFLEKYGINDFFVIEGLRNKEIAKKICKDLRIPFYMIADLDALYDSCDLNLSSDEIQKINECEALKELIPTVGNVLLSKFLLEKAMKLFEKKDICKSSKMLIRIDADETYKRKIEEEIAKNKLAGLHILRYGQLENYLDENGNVKPGSFQHERRKELEEIFLIRKSK